MLIFADVSPEKSNSLTNIGIGYLGMMIETRVLAVTLSTLPTTLLLPQKNMD